MSSRATAETTQREPSYRKRLIEIANLINSAPGIQEILVDLKDKMLDLVEAGARHHLRARHQEPGALLAVQGRATRSRRSGSPRPSARIAGFTALSPPRRRNIKNAYDAAELARLHPNLALRLALGQGSRASGTAAGAGHARSCSEKYLAGRARSSSTSAAAAPSAPKDEEAAEELVEDPRHRVLQPAPRAPAQQAHRKYGLLVDKGPHLREGPRERGRHARA